MIRHSIEDLFLSRETLLGANSHNSSLLIWLLLSLLVATVSWLVFAPVEDVVSGSGVVRTEANVSTVRNAVSGRILSIGFRAGQGVSRGHKLLEIDTAQYEAQRTELIVQAQETANRIDGIGFLLKSLVGGSNRIPPAMETPWTRFETWQAENTRLRAVADVDVALLEEERGLPPSATSATALRQRELQAETSMAAWRYQKFAFQRDILIERDELETQYKQVQAQLSRLGTFVNNASIVAPIDGIVQEVSSVNVGDYLQADQPILRLVPLTVKELQAEVHVNARFAGKLRVGMPVKLRFSSFPFAEFGGATGLVATIDPDSTRPQAGDPYFTLIITMDRSILTDRRGNQYPIRVGLQVDAKFVLETKRALSVVAKVLNLWN